MLTNDDDLETLKFRLIKRLIEKEIDRHVIYALLDFISIYLPFADKTKEPIFEQNIDSLIDKKPMEVMTIREYLVQKIEKQERAAAKRREKALEKRIKEMERRHQEAETRTLELESRTQEATKQSQELALEAAKYKRKLIMTA